MLDICDVHISISKALIFIAVEECMVVWKKKEKYTISNISVVFDD